MTLSAQEANSRSWLDTMLFAALVLGMIFACVILTWMAWQAPNVLAALKRNTPAPVVAQVSITFTVTEAPTVTPTATPTPIPPTSLPPTMTHTPEPSSTPTPSPSPTQPASDLPPQKRIVIDLSEQTLTAYEDDLAIFSALISAGMARTPTPIGEFAIYTKIRSQTMSGPGYSLPNVEFVAYFYSAYAIHGAYWHDNFGHPMSHGCVNMRVRDAEWLYGWAPIGTPVSVRQ